ncbi:MAG: prephenate dehydrogenase [Candidatus Omnitrophica bacterium]|nr:prephenate dehydrogenase [Candidatus Omnitrophota bacterium]
MFRKVAIIGTGLIGGSIGLALKKHRLAAEVVGVSRHKESISLARKTGAIDNGGTSLEIIRGADLVIFATPVNVIIDLAPKVAKIIERNCIVTDVASTKEEIVRLLEKIFPDFVGGHPLAGSEKRSISYASAGIFQGSVCLLTPAKKTKQDSLRKIRTLWENIGAKVILLSAPEHDKVLAMVSHLPHIAAFSLINSVPKGYLKFAAGGLKDTTRIAASDAEIWAQIFMSNRKNVLKSIEALERNISVIKSAIKQNKKQLSVILNAAKNKRESVV